MQYDSNISITILAEACFGEPASKTAIGVIRYGAWTVSSVIDSKQSGKFCHELINTEKKIPIVASLDEALKLNPQALLLGIAPVGGQIPQEWRQVIKRAIQAGLHIISGLHFFIDDDPEFFELAKAHGVSIWDVRDPVNYPASSGNFITQQRPRPDHLKVCTLVGSDCSVGKMFSALELYDYVRRRKRSSFVATGQTGIMISGRGIPLDRIIGDFMAGSMEAAIEEVINEENPEYIFVEGQGSLLHPAYSGVTLALLHGSNPDHLILCHKLGLQKIKGPYNIDIPHLSKLIKIYEEAATWIRATGSPRPPARVLGLVLNTFGYSEAEAREAIVRYEQELALPCTDPLRFGVGALVKEFNL